MRAMRHTASLAGFAIGEALIKAATALHTTLETAQRQLEIEQTKAKPVADKVKQLQHNVDIANTVRLQSPGRSATAHSGAAPCAAWRFHD